MLGKFFGKKARAARQAAVKIENRDLMQAAVYGVFYIASADGSIDQAELDKIDRLLRNAPQLANFGAELGNVIDRAKNDFKEGGPRIIRMNAEKELADLAHNPEHASIVMNFMLTVAEADGEIAVPEEMNVLQRAASKMNLRLEEFL